MDSVNGDQGKIVGEIENIIDENRVLGFSDAVFAFAATLLVLKIDLPNLGNGEFSTQLSSALIALWPTYLANIISFLIIGYYWLNHHAIFGLLSRLSKGIVWLNILFLVFLSFLPFPVELYGDYPMEKIAIGFYSMSLAIVGLFLLSIWKYANSHNLINKNLTKRHIRYYTLRLLVAPVVFICATFLVIVDPIISQFSWIFVAIGIILVNKFFHYKRLSVVEKLTV